MTTQPATAARFRLGFTLTELLITIAIVAVLVAIVGVVSTQAISRSRDAQTAAVQRSIGQGIASFKTDFGYSPPLVLERDGPNPGDVAEGILTPDVLQQLQGLDNSDLRERLRNERYASEYSITVYLLGIGRLNPDADADDFGVNPNGFARHDGVAGPGLKNPGQTKAWVDPADLRDGDLNVQPSPLGRTYGPYLDLGSFESALVLDADDSGSVAGGRGLYKIEDPFGTPIRYYRDWPINDPDDPGNRSLSSLAGVPPELFTGDALGAFQAAVADGGSLNAAVGGLDASVDRSLIGAEYALLSAGDDRLFGEDLNQDGQPDVGFGDDGSVQFTVTGAAAREAFYEAVGDNVRFTQ
jgi:prepilin-type N-terminal cleavage/methylation domain-containing protein